MENYEYQFFILGRALVLDYSCNKVSKHGDIQRIPAVASVLGKEYRVHTGMRYWL